MQRSLTNRQKLFIAEYRRHWNAKKAAIKAGYSVKTAAEKGYELIHKNSLVKGALDRVISENLMKIGVHAEKVLTGMANLAFADIRKLYRPDGTLLLPNEWPDDIAAAVAGVETFEEYQGRGPDRILIGHTKKVRLWDPNPALTNMCKYLGVIGNGKHHEEEEGGGEGNERVLTTLELSAKIVYLVKLAVKRKKEIEAQKALSGKSLDENPKELLK